MPNARFAGDGLGLFGLDAPPRRSGVPSCMSSATAASISPSSAIASRRAGSTSTALGPVVPGLAPPPAVAIRPGTDHAGDDLAIDDGVARPGRRADRARRDAELSPEQ